MSYPVECIICGSKGEHDVVDPLIPVENKVAYACPECDAIYRGPA